MTAPLLRPGRDEDAAGFIALVGACWAEYPGCVMDLDGEVPELRALASYYAGQGGALWAAEAGGRVVGMVGTKPLDGGAWELCKMYADAGQRGTGLAQALIDAAEGFARAHGAAEMKLWTDTRFDRAHRFYEKQGYVRSGPIRVLDDLSHSLEFAYAKPLAGVVVRVLDAAGAASVEGGLAALLRDCVAEGAALEFLPPMELAAARAYWKQKSREVALGQRLLLVAWVEGMLAGTVMLRLESSPDQPHGAHVQKLMVAPGLRRRGVARLLMRAAEQAAIAAGRPLVTLGARGGDPAEAMYRALGWTECGRIAGYTANAAGGFDDGVFFVKRL
ncbi:MAG: GNAT family N-acetyltransferase [Rhodospirillales bacterium]|nr:GNAT family N-acetyltransferase [Rhodospirillales bacterium]